MAPPNQAEFAVCEQTIKSVFQVCGVDEQGKSLLRLKLPREKLLSFFEEHERCTVVMEASGGAHHWGRMLQALGHEVKLIAPEAVRPFVKRGRKNDAADAAAICAAASRPDARFVLIKSAGQQAVLALHAARSLLVKQRTMAANAMRGLAAEFGVVVPKGMNRLDELAAQAEESLPDAAKRAFEALRELAGTADERSETLEAEIVAHARSDAVARRLATVPGIGPVTASLIAATVGENIGAFKDARSFAAWLGLVPRQNSTGGKTRLGRITKAGNGEIRSMLVLGATSMVYRAAQWNSAAGAWLRGVLARRPAKLAAVALASKLARIAWALMARGGVYRAAGGTAAAKVAA